MKRLFPGVALGNTNFVHGYLRPEFGPHWVEQVRDKDPFSYVGDVMYWPHSATSSLRIQDNGSACLAPAKKGTASLHSLPFGQIRFQEGSNYARSER
jgi:hypothetical protein